MNHSFAIDNRKCIGCHACSTACKSENQVPLGVNRTWVKVTETGIYPDARRHFHVTRCNHCANPPCVQICPVTAMYQRHDGIVEFDSDVCIGCKGCLQACPYDAIHIDPETGTAAKCHFCAHRVEKGLEPACVVVCPEHAIIAGDLDDPTSEISRVIARNEVKVRKPERGTDPNLFYIEGHDRSLHPTAAPTSSRGMMFTELRSPQGGQEVLRPVRLDLEGGPPLQAASINPIREPQDGPTPLGSGRMAGQMFQVAYNAQHEVPWHWQVPAYLVTKSVGAGVFGLLALAVVSGAWPVSATALVAGGLLGLVMLAATTLLLVLDLERPERFLSILLRPQWKSWITRGAFILIAFSTVAGLWWALETLAFLGWAGADLAADLRAPLAWATLPLAVAGAIYTAYLFAQAKGRDLWQSPLLPAHLLVQAGMGGLAGLLLLGSIGLLPEGLAEATRWGALGVLGADLFLLGLGEFGIPHATEFAARAAHDITRGRYARLFWLGAILVGHLLPMLLLGVGGPALEALAGLAILVGLYAYEHAFVMAPQLLPNS